MPSAAIATGLVDMVLPVARDAAAASPRCGRTSAAIRAADGGDAATAAQVRRASRHDAKRTAEKALEETLALLRKRTRHDFRHYKRATVLRRIERRLQVNAVPDLAAYRDYLDRHPAETGALLQDMLISVTSFFRDPDAFAALEKTVIPALFDGRDGPTSSACGCSACATGEEAYTIAMLLREQRREHGGRAADPDLRDRHRRARDRDRPRRALLRRASRTTSRPSACGGSSRRKATLSRRQVGPRDGAVRDPQRVARSAVLAARPDRAAATC